MSDPLRILREQKITLAQVCERLGADGQPVHFSTAFREATHGVLTPDGQRVRLETLKLGGRIMSSVEAVERFVAQTNGIDLAAVEAAPATASGKRRTKELAAIDRELEVVHGI